MLVLLAKLVIAVELRLLKYHSQDVKSVRKANTVQQKVSSLHEIYFHSREGNIDCLLCPPGKYQDSGFQPAKSCKTCEPGRRNTEQTSIMQKRQVCKWKRRSDMQQH